MMSTDLSSSKKQIKSDEHNQDLKDSNKSEQPSTSKSESQFYSRQLYALGEQAMQRLGTSRILISGLGGVGVEIAKNLVLAGVRYVTIHDSKLADWLDLSSQYYLTEDDVKNGKNRAQASFAKLRGLNDSVILDLLIEELDESKIEDHDLIILTEASFQEQLIVNEWTRARGKKFMNVDCRGLFGMIFNDFGPLHAVDNFDGERAKEALIEFIEKGNGDIICIEKTRHDLEDGDYVTFAEIRGMTELNQCSPRKVKVLDSNRFNVGDLNQYHDYVGGGRAIQVKLPVTHSFKPLSAAMHDPDYLVPSSATFDRPGHLHYIWQALHKFIEDKCRLPRIRDEKDAVQFVELCRSINSSASEKCRFETIDESLAKQFSYQAAGNICPVAGFIGGVAAQEAMKAVTSTLTPIKQWFYFDCFDCLLGQESPYFCSNAEDYQPNMNRRSRYEGQAAVFGWKLQDALAKQSWLIVGAGAIGCELLKYFAMVGLGCDENEGDENRLTITDTDIIELSNLNSQFLFCPSDVGRKKSEVAVEAAKRFNRHMRVNALCERVDRETENIFDDEFFMKKDGIANAVDNVETRTYVDRRCVYNRLPLLESGTSGTKGHVQVIYPNLTESYSCTSDPMEKCPYGLLMPIGTLKDFPYVIEHTIHYARDMFEELFTNPAELANQFLNDFIGFFERVDKMSAYQQLETLRTIKSVLVDERPASVNDCVEWARKLFEQNYNHLIKRLLTSFPADRLTSNGTNFWSGLKRCPHPLEFNPEDHQHVNFVYSATYLRGQMYGLKVDLKPVEIAKMANEVQIPDFVPEASSESGLESKEHNELMRDLRHTLAGVKQGNPQHLIKVDFECNDDTNHHVDFIEAASNLRAENYEIPKSDRLRTKQIAGGIVPAIVTTTAAVAGLAVLELYKIVGGSETQLNHFKNSFLNLALPFFGFAEPLLAPKKKYYENEWTCWDRFDVNGDMTLQQFVDFMKNEHRLEVSMLSYDVVIIYAFFMNEAKRKERLQKTITQLIESITKRCISSNTRSLKLEMMCVDDQGEDVEVPYVHYYLPSRDQS